MPRPTETPPASQAPLLAASIAPGPAAGDHREAGLDQLAAELLALGVRRVVGAGARRAEDADRRAELGERAEALDELRLDPQHAPRVGVHPVGRAARVEQPLVGGGPVDLRRARMHRRPLSFSASSGRSGHASASLLVSQVRSCRSQRTICVERHELVLLVGEQRVARAEVHRRDAEGAEPGDVGPAELRVRPSPPTASTNAAAAGTDSPGSAPGAESVTSISKPSKTSRTSA